MLGEETNATVTCSADWATLFPPEVTESFKYELAETSSPANDGDARLTS